MNAIPTVLMLMSCSQAPTYCDGYKQGLLSGWCSGHPAWVKCELSGQCPNKKGTFEDGYEDGMKEGLRLHQCGHTPCAESK